jgi:hypothetical protein
VAAILALHRPACAAPPLLRMRDLYAAGAEFSAQAQELNGWEVVVQGFMAPPLRAEAAFFVLTKLPMAVCPFCDSELDWPTDIVLVRLRRQQDWVEFNQPIKVRGILELGTDIDRDTGFVSRVRLVGAVYELA